MPRAPTQFDLAIAPGHLIRRAQQMHTAIWADVVDTGVTGVQFAVLAALEVEPDLDQRTLGARISLDSSSLAEVCRRLVARGLVERRRDTVDTRRNLLRNTATGSELLARTAPQVDEVGRRLVAHLEPAEQRDVVALLSKLIDL
ncbi:MarR family winged helix-turn-helix transcriptional regulator [Capillimicrobium parvum]|uniref:HTH-type transcriptional repressor NicR n=1 Tax=Capillimicrobium parvum TaxID=2884022 RepID=A0A9E6XVZ6_9ACTN|nr:MarR family winged helix-turn-helix transcriptional regulator [Capillimicrobium parvum]UGS35492.1 HTH-type transcriptional repressor NicR [Capillimicrobium parvum]